MAVQRAILKNQLAVLDMIQNNNWERPIYLRSQQALTATWGSKNFSASKGWRTDWFPFGIRRTRTERIRRCGQ